MKEKKYLKFYNKFGYGLGYGGQAMTTALIQNFILIIMTDSVGLNAAIVGTLMMISKILDGITDIFFGTIVDRTHSKWGKARPWMFIGGIGVAVSAVLTIAVPSEMNIIVQYAWFFVFYVVYNAVFITINGVSFNALTALITKNGTERVSLGVYSFIFGLGFQMVIVMIAQPIASAVGWAPLALIFAVIGLIFNTISVASVKELPEGELLEAKVEEAHNTEDGEGKIRLLDTYKMLLKNKYYIRVLLMNILFTISVNLGTAAVYYFTYVYQDANMYGTINGMGFGAMLIGLFCAPLLTKKIGVYKTNLYCYSTATVLKLFFGIAVIIRNVPLMIIFNILNSIFGSPIAGTMNAVTADIADYQYKKNGKRIDGAMYSCVSMGTKIGAALGTGMTGWLLAASGYVANAAQQPESCITMLTVLYIIVPLILMVVGILLLAGLNVKKAIAKLEG